MNNDTDIIKRLQEIIRYKKIKSVRLKDRVEEFMLLSCEHITAWVDERGELRMSFEDLCNLIGIHEWEKTDRRALSKALREHQCGGLKLDIQNGIFIWTRRKD